MRVVLDTNVLVAAFATEGLCHALFELCVDQHEIVMSDHILKELADGLETKLRVPSRIAQDTVRYLRQHSLMFQQEPPVKRVCRDPADDWILTLADQAGAQHIITGDQDLLVLSLSELRYPHIILPREFWEILRTRKDSTEDADETP